MTLYISSEDDTHGKIEIPGLSYSVSFNVSSKSITTVSIPKAAYLKDEGLYNTGIHVTTEKPIVIFAHIYNLNVSGATLVLPVNNLGKDYYSINYKQISNEENSYSFFFVVAIEDQTEVEITPSSNTRNGWKAGQTYKVSLSKGQIYQVLGEYTGKDAVRVIGNTTLYNYKGSDLSGSRIKSVSSATGTCKRIAVFCGSSKIGIGCGPYGVTSSDNLFQQAYPTEAWGKRFISVPFSSRDYDIIRIVKSTPSAKVRLNGNEIASTLFNNDFYYEFPTREVNLIESDLPIQVVQYSVSQQQSADCTSFTEMTGDPEMVFLNSLEQNTRHISVYSPSAYLIKSQFINVVIATAEVSQFRLDSTDYSSLFKPVPGDVLYSYAQIPVSFGIHTLTASKGFNAVAYGFGNAESYGYSAGANVKGTEVVIKTVSDRKEVTSGCTKDFVRLTVNLVNRVNKISVDFQDGSPLYDFENLTPDTSFNRDGKVFYSYELNRDFSFRKAGNYNLKITADKENADDCGDEEVILFGFSVFDPPESRFSFNEVCEGRKTIFKDESNGNGRMISSWLWDFGDGHTSTMQHPEHIYANPGTYNVALTVISESPCNAVTSASAAVFVRSLPVASFTYGGQCNDHQVQFNDLSTIADGTIVGRYWAFGDGSGVDLTTETSVKHRYSLPGKYAAKLKVLTDKGCENEIVELINIYPIPLVDFSVPEVCLQDAFAQFSDLSSISDNSEAGFTYYWDFGDPNADISNPNNSSEKNPKHRFSAAAEYIVTLSVTSSEGCSVSRSKQVVVNGSKPVARFEVMDESHLCGNRPVAFKNLSEVDFGKVTRLEWYFDYSPVSPGSVLIDNNPQQGTIQTHFYPSDAHLDHKDYTVRLLAFSGPSCVDEFIKIITIKPTAVVSLSVPSEVCQGTPPFNIAPSLLSGNISNGHFEGAGVSSEGNFDPARAGEGLHGLLYIFSSGNGCIDTAEARILVHSVPAVDAGDDKYVIFGGSVSLLASSDDDIVKYEWQPATGLSRTDIANPVASPSEDITYNISITDRNGCTASDKVKVTVLDSPKIPNAFTPNGDSVNDFWSIEGLQSLPFCTVTVFNRVGVKVFASQGYDYPWDGRCRGNELPVGVYYYVINPANGKPVLTGYVSIIK